MSSALKNLSAFTGTAPRAENMRFGIVVAEWNAEVTEALYQGAYATLLQHGAKQEHIKKVMVPGSFELTFGASVLAESDEIDAIICLGCVIQGETRHFDFICQAVASGLTELNILYKKPVIFGVLTTDNLEQARERSGGKHGNKGDEAAVTAIKTLSLKRSLEKIVF